MSWILGAGLGFLRGGPFGALLGGAAQHFISKAARKKVRHRLPGMVDENLFVTCAVVVLTKVAMAKGAITPGKVETIYRFFVRNLDYNTKDLDKINRVIRETLRINPDLKPVVEKYHQAGGSRYKGLLLALAYQQALVEDPLTPEVQACIDELAQLLGLTYEAHDQIRRKYSLQALVTPYSILGVEEGAGNEEIKKAYRRRLADCHPDKAAHLGEVPVEEAHLKFLELQAAYETIKKTRKL
ncbi:MAG: DnaJ domain-containing protein [Nitrospinaceae bacterium]